MPLKRFKKFYIEITNVCNLSCDFCPTTKRKPEFMSLETFEEILRQAKPYTDYIYLHVKGEPFLHPQIDKILDISNDFNMKVNITTNGTLIREVKDKILDKPALRQINFSLHSMDGNEKYNKKDEYITNILDFTKEALDKTKIIISYRLWNLDMDNQINIKNQKNQKILREIEERYQLPYRIEDEVTAGNGIKIGERLYLNQDHVFSWPALDENEDEGIGFCYGLRNQIAVLVDGTVVPCCLDGEGVINLGNIIQTEFNEILESKRATDIFEGFSNRYAVEELCRKCGYRKKFGS